ncbi:MAG: hypothetical protein R2857_08100 [Vampirovibrionales bacterium]
MVSPIPNALARQASHSMMQDFAHASAINKGILDIIGIDVPLIAVAKNNLERKERAFQQAITFLIFFMLAPCMPRCWAESSEKPGRSKADAPVL